VKGSQDGEKEIYKKEKISTNYISDKGLVLRTYEESSKLNSRKAGNSTKIWPKK
jgi:hypothetical protein